MAESSGYSMSRSNHQCRPLPHHPRQPTRRLFYTSDPFAPLRHLEASSRLLPTSRSPRHHSAGTHLNSSHISRTGTQPFICAPTRPHAFPGRMARCEWPYDAIASTPTHAYQTDHRPPSLTVQTQVPPSNDAAPLPAPSSISYMEGRIQVERA